MPDTGKRAYRRTDSPPELDSTKSSKMSKEKHRAASERYIAMWWYDHNREQIEAVIPRDLEDQAQQYHSQFDRYTDIDEIRADLRKQREMETQQPYELFSENQSIALTFRQPQGSFSKPETRETRQNQQPTNERTSSYQDGPQSVSTTDTNLVRDEPPHGDTQQVEKGDKRKRDLLDEDAPATKKQKPVLDANTLQEVLNTHNKSLETPTRLETLIQYERLRTIEKYKNQSNEHFVSLYESNNLVKENRERIKTFISSIETLIQKMKEKSVDSMNTHFSFYVKRYMQPGYVDEIRENFEEEQNTFKNIISTNANKKEAKEAYNRIKALLEDPMPKTLEDLNEFKASLKKQTDIKTEHFDRRRKLYEEHSMYQAEFIDDLEAIEKRLTAHISGQSQSDLFEDFFPFGSSEPFDLDEEMTDIAKTGLRPGRESPDTPIEGSPSHSSTESLDLDDIGKDTDTARDPLFLFGGTESFSPGEMIGTARQTSPEITEPPSPKGSPPHEDNP